MLEPFWVCFKAALVARFKTLLFFDVTPAFLTAFLANFCAVFLAFFFDIFDIDLS
ncbi:hypothetical protein NTGM5_390001 [Candidatus Nitrotoga sp. M5]|nr:hypothetical protein NTGM5_390001 [Candidatus Nitrotoga sp. M5]